MKMRTMMAMLAVLAIGAICWAGDEAKDSTAGTIGVIVLGGGVLGMAAVLPSVKDALLKDIKSLPGGASTIYSTGIDTDVTPSGVQPKDVEYLLTAPALAVGQLANDSTMTYSILTDTVKPLDGSSPVLISACIVQTGAGGAGAAAVTYRCRLASDAGRIVGFKAANSAAADASAAIATLEALF